jgi:hypothetical protein
MQKPNIFLHYYNNNEANVSFQEIIQSDVAPEILEIIQEELLDQLADVMLAEKLPNFDWQNARMQEKWQSAVNLLLPHVLLPDFIWQGWIASIQQEMRSPQAELPTFADLLTADVYYATPSDSLPEIAEEEPLAFVEEDIAEQETLELPEEKEEVVAEEGEEIVVEEEVEEVEEEVVEEEEEEVEEEVVEEENKPALDPILDYFDEVSNELPEIEITAKEADEIERPKSINDLHAESGEEKVLDTIQVTDHSLKNLVEINMTQSLWESISLFQKLNFIQDLFEGNADEFQRLIEFVDTQATATKWKSEIEGQFGTYLNSRNEDTWNEFYILVDRKFN